jgi:hypothetical protein
MGQTSYPCPWCAQTPGGGPLPSAALDRHREEAQVEAAKQEIETVARRRRRLKSHAITGAITFFLLSLLLGLPLSLRISALLVNLFTSMLFGIPAGFLISWLHAGRMKGAFICMGVFFVLEVIMGLVTREAGDALRDVMAGALIRSPAGALPGWIIGLHVEVDD